MEWLSQLPSKEVITKKQRKQRPKIRLANGVPAYKRQYYIENYSKYSERNQKASEERTNQRIDELSNPLIIYKLKYILDHDNGC
jgi:hypothetical protein